MAIEQVSLPIDHNARTVPIVPARTSLASAVTTPVSSSTQISVNASTSFIEITAVSSGVYLKWGTTAVTTSNFDEYVHDDNTRHYAIPVDSTTGLLYTAFNVIDRVSGASTVVTIQK